MTDIVERLRVWERGAVGRPRLYDDAADEIESLRSHFEIEIEVNGVLRSRLAEADALLREARGELSNYHWLRYGPTGNPPSDGLIDRIDAHISVEQP